MTTHSQLFPTMLALAGPSDVKPGSLRLASGERIVAIGDSITQGGGHLHAIEAVFTQRYPNVALPPIVNAGVSGEKAEDLLARFDRHVLRRKPDVVTISVGINDVWHRLEAPHDDKVLAAYQRNVEEMVRMAQDADIRVFLLAPTVIEENAASEGNKRLAKYVDAGKDVARRRSCDYVDLHGLFLRAIERRAQAGGPRLTSDGVHMEPPGDVLMAVGILRAWGVPDAKMAATDLSEVFH